MVFEKIKGKLFDLFVAASIGAAACGYVGNQAGQLVDTYGRIIKQEEQYYKEFLERFGKDLPEEQKKQLEKNYEEIKKTKRKV